MLEITQPVSSRGRIQIKCCDPSLPALPSFLTQWGSRRHSGRPKDKGKGTLGRKHRVGGHPVIPSSSSSFPTALSALHPGLAYREPGLLPAPTASYPLQTQHPHTSHSPLHLMGPQDLPRHPYSDPREGEEHHPAWGCQLHTRLHVNLRPQQNQGLSQDLPPQFPALLPPNPQLVFPSQLLQPLPHILHTEKVLKIKLPNNSVTENC